MADIKIPRVMSTQRHHNVRPPFFAENQDMSGNDEIQEAYYVFSHLGCDEQMWNCEGKEVDDFVVGNHKYPFYPCDISISRWFGEFCPLEINAIPNFDFDMETSIAFFNEEVSDILPREASSALKLDWGTKSIYEDHREVTSRFIKALGEGHTPILQPFMLEVGHIRKFPG